MKLVNIIHIVINILIKILVEWLKNSVYTIYLTAIISQATEKDFLTGEYNIDIIEMLNTRIQGYPFLVSWNRGEKSKYLCHNRYKYFAITF